MKRGDPLGFINIHSVAKYQKTRRGDSFETLKNFRKKISHSAEKKLKGVATVIVGLFSLKEKAPTKNMRWNNDWLFQINLNRKRRRQKKKDGG